MKNNKKEKKENKKILDIVKKEFHYKKNEPSSFDENRIKSIAKSVIVNKAVLQREKDAVKKWQKEYYQELFAAFKALVMEHNERMAFKADILASKILAKRTELDKLKSEIKKLKEEKEVLKHA